MSLLAAQMVYTVEEMVPFDILSGYSPLTYRRYIRVAKFLLDCFNILSTIVEMDGRMKGSWTLCISHLDDGTISRHTQKKMNRFWSVPPASTSENR